MYGPPAMWEAIAGGVLFLQLLTLSACFRCEQRIAALLRRGRAEELRRQLELTGNRVVRRPPPVRDT